MKLPKILSEKEKTEQEKTRSRWITAFIVFVLMASTAAFALTSNSTSENVKYKGFTFIKTENGWQIKNTEVLTTFLPTDVENISSPLFSPDDFKKDTYFLAMTSSEQMAANELNRAFYNVITKAQLACSKKYENESFCAELPVKDCENEADGLIIELEETENQSIEFKNSCISIKGNEIDLIKVADRIIFSAYKII